MKLVKLLSANLVQSGHDPAQVKNIHLCLIQAWLCSHDPGGLDSLSTEPLTVYGEACDRKGLHVPMVRSRGGQCCRIRVGFIAFSSVMEFTCLGKTTNQRVCLDIYPMTVRSALHGHCYDCHSSLPEPLSRLYKKTLHRHISQ